LHTLLGEGYEKAGAIIQYCSGKLLPEEDYYGKAEFDMSRPRDTSKKLWAIFSFNSISVLDYPHNVDFPAIGVKYRRYEKTK